MARSVTAADSTHPAWVAENPIRKFRRRNDLSVLKAAFQIGCSLSTIQKWEAGVGQPDPVKFMPKIAVFLGVSEKTLVRNWDAWMKAKPPA